MWESWNDLVGDSNDDAPSGMNNSSFTALYHFCKNYKD